ncbi:unannotated protein [freshwater metagenome]|uniref:Unannotated protein n=1 Tax=freshwater metagenome TaxID=449393 RepID=A0A6J6XQL6_9ZZZZ
MGCAINLGGDDRSRYCGAEILLLDFHRNCGIGGEKEARAHGNTTGPVGKRRNEASAIEIATSSNNRNATADNIDDLRQKQRGWDRTRVAATFATLHEDGVDTPLHDFLSMTFCTDRRHHLHAVIVQVLNEIFFRSLGE